MRRIAQSVVVALVAAGVLSGTPRRADLDLEAHRGGRGETTEESLRAFAKALELGVSTLELDIVLSKDRQPMVWHDLRIEAAKCSDTTPAFAGDPLYPYVGKRVVDMTFDELRTLDCGKRLDAFPDAEVVSPNRIATLPEVLALVAAYGADVRFDIETKIEANDPSELVDVILGAIRAAGKVDKVSIQSFDWRTLPLVRKAEPTIPLVALWDEKTWTSADEPMAAAKRIGADVLAPRYALLDEGFCDRAHALGLAVVPWTINDADAMRAAIAAGVDGVITDYPGRLRAVMAELGMPLPRSYARQR